MCTLLATGALLTPGDKTDQVSLANGDMVTCEIKVLERGTLTVKTDAMDSVEIRWGYVERITSPDRFAVELDDGTRLFGFLAEASEPGFLRVVAPPESGYEVPLFRVVVIDELGVDLLDRLKGNLSLGFTFTQASDVSQLSLAFELDVGSETDRWNVRASTINTTQEQRDPSNRSNVGVGYRYLLGNRWFAGANTSLQRNDQLGLDLRALLGASGGRDLLQSRSMLLSTAAGVNVNREINRDAPEQNNIEGLLSVDYDWFLLQSPKLDLSTGLKAFPSFTTSGRLRGQFDTRLRKEFAKDLYFGLTLYGDYDSTPPSGATSSSDFGIITSIDYSW